MTLLSAGPLSRDARPDQLLAAAMLQAATAAAIAGDAEAVRWLRHCAYPWLELVTPDDVDPDAVLGRILARVDP